MVVLNLSLYTQSLHYLRQVDEVHELYSPVSTVMVCNGEGVVLGCIAYICVKIRRLFVKRYIQCPWAIYILHVHYVPKP